MKTKTKTNHEPTARPFSFISLAVLLAAAALGATACDGNPLAPEGAADTPDHVSTNLKLASAARELGIALRDPRLRAELGTALAAKPTGDFEVLLRDARGMHLSDGRTLGDVLAPTGIDAEPLAHIAAPGGVPTWSAGQPVEVAWWPAGSDDADVLELFDGAGNARSIATEARPATPVVVVALNERVSAPAPAPEGDVTLQQSALSATLCNSYVCTASNCRDVRLGKVKIYNDHEPWTKGDPEIYLFCTTPGARFDEIYVACGSKDLPGVNDEDKWYTYNSALFSNLSVANGIQCHLMERDEGRASPVDSDDSLGSATIYYGDGARTYYVNDGVFTLY